MKEPQYRNAKEIVRWADNLTLFCALANQVNEGCIEKLIIKYFVKGYTFMSTDSFHAVAESNMLPKRNLYDFQDCDFHDHQGKLSSGKDTHYPLVKEISVS